MGQHYVPQRYLRNFEPRDQPEFIWLHKRTTRDAVLAPIKQVAQTRGFYPAEVEEALARAVEGPTYPIIEKIRRREVVSPADRHQLALFVATMVMRVPATRKNLRARYPERVTDYFRGVRDQLREVAAEDPHARAALEQNLAACDVLERKFLAEGPTGELADLIVSPWPFGNMVRAIEGMAWRILTTDGPLYFITSDNPAFFFDDYGLASRESELSIPLASDTLLHGSWQATGSPIAYLASNQHWVREMNRRLASVAEFAFYNERAEWLLRLLQKEGHYLSQIRWADPPRWMAIPPFEPDGERHEPASS